MSAPREIGPGAWWLGDCIAHDADGVSIHLHFSAFLVVGSERTLLYDTGYPPHWPVIAGQLGALLGARELDFVVASHPELPHAGNLGSLLALYPRAVATGDVRDLHLYYPGFEGRFERRRPGDEIDLGDRRFRFLPAVLHDLANTIWGYDEGSRTLFASDGFIYSHNPAAAAAAEPIHAAGECRLLLSELPTAKRSPAAFRMSAEGLYWTRRRDPEPAFDELEALLAHNPTRVIAPTHGNLIDGDLEESVRFARQAHRAVFDATAPVS
jgi:flavorubredoxin